MFQQSSENVSPRFNFFKDVVINWIYLLDGLGSKKRNTSNSIGEFNTLQWTHTQQYRTADILLLDNIRIM